MFDTRRRHTMVLTNHLRYKAAAREAVNAKPITHYTYSYRTLPSNLKSDSPETQCPLSIIVSELLVTECGVILRQRVVTSHHLREIAVTASLHSPVHTYHTSRQNTHRHFATSETVRHTHEMVDHSVA